MSARMDGDAVFAWVVVLLVCAAVAGMIGWRIGIEEAVGVACRDRCAGGIGHVESLRCYCVTPASKNAEARP